MTRSLTDLGWPCLLLALACGSKAEPSPVGEVEPSLVGKAEPRAATAPEAGPHLARSRELEQAGDLAGALAEAEAAVAAGGGRDASVHAAKLAILREDYDAATAFLGPLVAADAADAVAQYNLALAYQHKGDYNRARNGYLAALRADPRQADARYNLAVLCFERGIHEEARHHVAKFRSTYVDDPRGPALERMVGGMGAAGPGAASAEAAQ